MSLEARERVHPLTQVLRLAAALVQLIGLGALGLIALWYPAEWFNAWLRAGVAMFCLTNAILPFFPAHPPAARLVSMSVVQAAHTRTLGLATAAALICVGGAVARTPFGYLAALAAVAYLFMQWWSQRMAGPEW